MKAIVVLLILTLLVGAVLAGMAMQRAALRRVARPRQLAPLPPLTRHWWTDADIASAQSMLPRKFGPNTRVTLPSGRVVLGVDIPRIAAIGGPR